MESRRLTRRSFLTRPVADRSAADYLVRVHRRIMACRVEVVLPGEDSEYLSAARAALDEGDRLEDVMTIFREAGELARVNREAHRTPVVVSDDLFDVLSRAAILSDRTGGAFDITSAPLSRCWGFLQRDGRRPREADIQQARLAVGMHLVEMNASARIVYFRRDGVFLNLGSIGKGFALERMAATLDAQGAGRALISAGTSSILARGGTSMPWRIDLRTAVDGARLARLRITDGAVGTSGAGEQFFEMDGVRYGHVIDPRTGWPASGVLSASVVTASAASADALSTAFLIGGCELARRYCDEHENVLAIVTPDDGARRPVVFGAYAGASVELT